MKGITLNSPDKKRNGKLIYAGEIRFGPAYFHLQFPNCDFGGRIFGEDYLWSLDSRYLAIQESLTIDYSDGPYTELLLIDFLSGRQCPLSKVRKGFIVPVRFEPPVIIYRKEFRGRGEHREFEIAYEVLDRWRPLFNTRKS